MLNISKSLATNLVTPQTLLSVHLCNPTWSRAGGERNPLSLATKPFARRPRRGCSRSVGSTAELGVGARWLLGLCW